MDVFKKDGLRVFRRRLFESNVPLVQPSAACPTEGYSLGALAPKHNVTLPKTEKMRPGADAAVLPAGFQRKRVMFPSRKENGTWDTIYVPTTEETKSLVKERFNRAYARSLVECQRATGALVPMTPLEIAVEKKRYKDEKAILEGRSGGDFIQMFPVFGDDISRGSTKEWAKAMGGLDWMTRKEIRESIPPPYSRYLGQQVLSYIRTRIIS